jgi:hypothetical protein
MVTLSSLVLSIADVSIFLQIWSNIKIFDLFFFEIGVKALPQSIN